MEALAQMLVDLLWAGIGIGLVCLLWPSRKPKESDLARPDPFKNWSNK
jgi:hypothetical protein